MATFTWTLVTPTEPAPSVPATDTGGEATARNLLLDDDGDLDLTGGRLNFARGAVAVRQSLRTRLGLWLGEWFLDLEEGVDYRGTVFVKVPSFTALRATFRERILETPGVAEVLSLSLDYTTDSRQLSIAYEVSTDLGELNETPAVVADSLTLEV